MWIHLNEEDPKPLYLQLKEQIIRAILNGTLKPGDELPSIRRLASDARTSVITVKRAYQELEYEDYIFAKQGKGSFVKEQNKEQIKRRYQKQFADRVEELIHYGESYRLSYEDMKEIIEQCFQERGKL